MSDNWLGIVLRPCFVMYLRGVLLRASCRRWWRWWWWWEGGRVSVTYTGRGSFIQGRLALRCSSRPTPPSHCDMPSIFLLLGWLFSLSPSHFPLPNSLFFTLCSPFSLCFTFYSPFDIISLLPSTLSSRPPVIPSPFFMIPLSLSPPSSYLSSQQPVCLIWSLPSLSPLFSYTFLITIIIIHVPISFPTPSPFLSTLQPNLPFSGRQGTVLGRWGNILTQ